MEIALYRCEKYMLQLNFEKQEGICSHGLIVCESGDDDIAREGLEIY